MILAIKRDDMTQTASDLDVKENCEWQCGISYMLPLAWALSLIRLSFKAHQTCSGKN